MSERTVSICIPSYNYAAFIGGALESACAQTYRDVEIIVSDNCSTDGTEQVIARLAARDARIRYSRNDRNIGMHANFNRCLELAAGPYVKLLCADDLLEPDCVERMVEALHPRPDVALVGCARRIVDADLRPLGSSAYARRAVEAPGLEAIRRCFFRGNLIGEPTAVMFRKSDARRGFSESYAHLVDLEMWFHLLRRGAFLFLPEPLCRIRRHESQATQDNMRWGAVFQDKQRLFRELRGEVEERGSILGKTLWDARMAVTARRTLHAGYPLAPGEIEEIFFPRLFRTLTYPVSSTLWKLAR